MDSLLPWLATLTHLPVAFLLGHSCDQLQQEVSRVVAGVVWSSSPPGPKASLCCVPHRPEIIVCVLRGMYCWKNLVCGHRIFILGPGSRCSLIPILQMKSLRQREDLGEVNLSAKWESWNLNQTVGILHCPLMVGSSL